MKFLPTLRPLVLVATVLTLDACSTAANRRELYNTSAANGPWHDYQRRRESEAAVGLPPGSMATTTTTTTTTAPGHNGRPTPMPRSGPITNDVTTPPSAVTPAAPTAPVTPPDPAVVAPGIGAVPPIGGDAPIAPPPPAPPQ